MFDRTTGVLREYLSNTSHRGTTFQNAGETTLSLGSCDMAYVSKADLEECKNSILNPLAPETDAVLVEAPKVEKTEDTRRTRPEPISLHDEHGNVKNDELCQEVHNKIVQLLNKYACSEKAVEVTRSVLVERPGFEAYLAYGRVTTAANWGITNKELATFLEECGLCLSDYDMDLLFFHLDNDSDGVINWREFSRVILNMEYQDTFKFGGRGVFTEFTMECENSLLRVFEQEVLNEKMLEEERRQLWEINGVSEELIFDEMDRENRGYLNIDDFSIFLKEAFKDYNDAQVHRCFRRFDKDQDGKVSYDEFLKAVRPLYAYKAYFHFGPVVQGLSPSKIFRKTKIYDPERAAQAELKLKNETHHRRLDSGRYHVDKIDQYESEFIASRLGQSGFPSQGKWHQRSWLPGSHDKSPTHSDINKSWAHMHPKNQCIIGTGPSFVAGPWGRPIEGKATIGGPWYGPNNTGVPEGPGPWRNYWKDFPYQSGSRVERSIIYDQLVKRHWENDPLRERWVRENALAEDAEYYRRTHHTRYANPVAEVHTERAKSSMGLTETIRTRIEYSEQRPPKDTPTAAAPSENVKTLSTCLHNSLKDIHQLEEKRKNLSMRFDFCLTDNFK